ncbi:glucan endo-1,3-beta-D-glucosidase [Olea europaea var. sylvestris]|uniref:glucan endo-1,3-beta-D-glucosidase n=2 Tax=Olea europaea TaxID=4146 RepID=UPI000C1D0595|nr:glucan endo-1,3-beta-D-glucosidase [Olea europaea var. sylvestris]
MAANVQTSSLLFLVFLLLQNFYSANSQSFLGVNYGQLSDNLPSLQATVNLLKSTTIQKVRLFGAEPAVIKAFANTGVEIVIGFDNGDIPTLASNPNVASQFVKSNVMSFYPASNIIAITVGNEVLTSGDQKLISQLLPAMQNVQNALNAASLGGKVKVSTVHAMAVLSQSYPPSSGVFNPGLGDTMKALLQFQSANDAPFMISPYPYFAYKNQPTPDTLAFCLFQPNAGQVDSGNGHKYTNMFDAQVDAVHSALNAMGFKDIEIVVAETGWPHGGDSNEVGPSLDNAKAYVGNLINHLKSKVGTPLMPGKSIDTYLFSLYDEDKKTGASSEKYFGLFKPDGSTTYDVGLLKNTQNPTTPATPTPTPKAAGSWCVPKPGVSDDQLTGNINYACSQGIDCGPIQPGGACFEPNTVKAHAAYVMNLYYQHAGRNSWNCDFSQTATLTNTNPSYGACNFPSGSN